MAHFRFIRASLPLAVCGLVLQACSVSKTVKYDEVEIDTAQTEIPTHELLDVGILLFNPNIPESVEEQQKDFVFPEVRRAEARYMPYLLVEAIQSSGAWGAVRVVPNENQAMDLMVAGTILRSHGEQLKLRIELQGTKRIRPRLSHPGRGQIWPRPRPITAPRAVPLAGSAPAGPGWSLLFGLRRPSSGTTAQLSLNVRR